MLFVVIVVEVELEVDAAVARGWRREPGLDRGGCGTRSLCGLAPPGCFRCVDHARVPVEADDEDKRADRDEVAGGEFGLALQPMAVDERAIARPEVAQVQPAVSNAKLAVPPRDAGDGDAELAVGPTPHGGHGVIERDLPLATVGSDMDEGSVHAGGILLPSVHGSPVTGSLPPGFTDHHTVLTVLTQRERPSAHPLAAIPPGWRGVASLYIHVPFCSHKCHYCDFYSLVDTRDRQAVFVDRLARELEGVAPWFAGVPLRTVFVGGGTPSLLRIDLWERLLGLLHRCFDTGAIDSGEGEFTVECNPETASEGLMAVLAAGGVNRVSIGAQSFESRHLRMLERRHDPENVARAVEAARRAGIAKQSVDLIFGVPGQTMKEWERDLDRAVGLGTTHLSCYALTYEPNTAMTARMRRGEFEPIDEETEAEMMRWTAERLRGARLARYEVSNFASPGAECRHNLAYWRQEQWIGVGPSAASHVLDPVGGSRRWRNVPRLDDYLGSNGALGPVVDAEGPDPRRLLAERLMTGVRVAEGVDATRMLTDALAIGGEAAEKLEACAARLVGQGWLEARDGRWRPTEDGFLFADRIARDLMAAVA